MRKEAAYRSHLSGIAPGFAGQLVEGRAMLEMLGPEHS